MRLANTPVTEHLPSRVPRRRLCLDAPSASSAYPPSCYLICAPLALPFSTLLHLVLLLLLLFLAPPLHHQLFHAGVAPGGRNRRESERAREYAQQHANEREAGKDVGNGGREAGTGGRMKREAGTGGGMKCERYLIRYTCMHACIHAYTVHTYIRHKHAHA